MRTERYYKVAGHLFSVRGEQAHFALMSNYEGFSCSPAVDDILSFTLDIETGEAFAYTEEWRQEEEGQEIVCGRTDDGHFVFEFIWNRVRAGWLTCDKDYRQGSLRLVGDFTKLAIDNALMILYALANADKGTVLFHASTVSYEGRGYMFLGESGTGKSTHASLWLNHINGAELVNDDNPVVRIGSDGKPYVYGSPWSGKTPCYRNVSYPLGGIVALKQAPYNKISRLSGIKAYIELMTSISGKRWDKHISNGLHETENALASSVPTWHLECLPDAAAAELCCKTIAN